MPYNALLFPMTEGHEAVSCNCGDSNETCLKLHPHE